MRSFTANITNLIHNKYFALLLAVLISMGFTLFNHYPILYSDSSTYISSGFELETPFDRPITYGILLRLFSLGGLSFTFVPLVQTLIFFLCCIMYWVFSQRISKFPITYYRLLLF